MLKCTMNWTLMSAVLLLSTTGCEHKPEHYQMPTIDQIESVHVTLFGFGMGYDNTDTFMLPPSNVKVLLETLSPDPVKASRGLHFGLTMMRLEFDLNEGSPFIIEVIDGGKDRIRFRSHLLALLRNNDYPFRDPISGRIELYQQDEGWRLYHFLRNIWLEQQGGQ